MDQTLAPPQTPQETIMPSGTTTLSVEEYPYLMNCQLTVEKNNPVGVAEKRFLTAVFPLDNAGVKAPWSVLANVLAPQYVTRQFGNEGSGWTKIYERKILKIVHRLDPNNIKDIPLRVMTTDQLKLYCVLKEINVNVDEFHNVEKARQMVQLRLDDPTGFEIHLEEYRKGVGQAAPELKKAGKDLRVLDTNFEDEFAVLNSQSITLPTQTHGVSAPSISDTVLQSPSVESPAEASPASLVPPSQPDSHGVPQTADENENSMGQVGSNPPVVENPDVTTPDPGALDAPLQPGDIDPNTGQPIPPHQNPNPETPEVKTQGPRDPFAGV